MKKMDLHIHTTYSDGALSIRGVIETAHSKNLEYIAITDHFTTSWKESIIDTINHKNITKYVTEIKAENALTKVKCLVGIEIDMDSNLHDIKKIPFNSFDIILFEYVESIKTLKDVVTLKNDFGIQAITALAHNSYFKLANLEKLSNLLIENDIHFELNSRYLNHSNPNDTQKLRIMKDYGVKFTLGSDAHGKSQIGDLETPLLILNQIEGFDNLISLP